MAKRINTFNGEIGRTYLDTVFSFEHDDVLPKNHPNVVYIVLDDMGFASLGCYGNTVISTPHIDALAHEGLRFNDFHTTAICSATRASLLTGANHHNVGCNSLIETVNGTQNGLGMIDPAYATAAELLHDRGYATFAVGKWHLSSVQDPHGPYDGWPLAKGFDNYYGFLTGEGDQFHPLLVRDNSFVEQPASPDEGYHLSEDLTDNAIRYVFNQVNAHPEQPFFLYLAYGATHTPFQAPSSYIERYRGKFDEGWDVLRRRWFENQKQLGVIPQDADISPRGQDVQAWDDLPDDERRLYARYMETFAGFLEHTDAQIGRLVDYLEQVGVLDDTVIVFLSDNGASSEGGVQGKFNSHIMRDSPLNKLIHVDDSDRDKDKDIDLEMGLEHFDEIGSEYSFSHYPLGWANALNTPFPWYKVFTYDGGTRDPLIIRYPRAIHDPGSVRNQYMHVSDITPTVAGELGIAKPDALAGVAQKPFDGKSFSAVLRDGSAASPRREQHYEIWGNRSIYKQGWFAAVNHIAADGDYDRDVWELYHVAEDYSQVHDVAAEHPQKLRELQDEWLVQAARNNVFPMLEVRPHRAGVAWDVVRQKESERVYKKIIEPFILPGRDAAVDAASHFLIASISHDRGDEGVIFSSGGRFGGFSLYIKDNRLRYGYNANLKGLYEFESDAELPTGDIKVGYLFTVRGDTAEADLIVNGDKVGHLDIPQLYYRRGWATTIKADPYSECVPRYEAPFEYSGDIDRVVLHALPYDIRPKEELAKIAHAE